MASHGALASYLLVKKALDSVGTGRLPRLGRTADAERGDDYESEGENEAFFDLAAAVGRLKAAAPFAVGGRIDLCASDRACTLVMAGKGAEVAGVAERTDAAALLPFCTRAKFGDAAQRTNREDPSVRVAWELAAGAWELRGGDGAAPRFLAVIRDRVQAALVDERRAVELVPQKVNVYEAGGFFAEHVDTPSDAREMLGTVLVCLPSTYAGGALAVRHNGAAARFAFAERSGTAGAVQWAAFYSDCLHSVETVASGARVTVAYAILARKAHPAPPAPPAACAADVLTHAAWPAASRPCLDEVVGLLERLRGEEGQSAVGIYLSHMYTHEALTPAGLKGADRVLHTHLCGRWGVALMHVLQKVHQEGPNSEDEGDDGGGDHNREYSNQVFPFTAQDLDALARGGSVSQPAGLADVPFVTPWSAKEVINETTKRTAGSNQGNWYEAGSKEVDCLYLQAALIVRLSAPL